MMNSSSSHEQQPQRRRRPKVLCLGVSFPCIEQSAKQAGISLPQSVVASSSYLLAQQQPDTMTAASQQDASVNILDQTTDDSNERLSLDNDENDHDGTDIHEITAMVQDCVQTNILTQMDGRDLLRCLVTERSCNVDVYTVSQECGAVYNRRRHLHANFNRSNFVTKLQRHFGCSSSTSSSSTSTSSSDSDSNSSPTSSTILFDQITLDYFWIPLGWDTQHWTRKFFSQVLVDLCQVLQPCNNNDGTGGKTGGVVYLPFCYHCFQQVLVCRENLKRHYNISFVRKGTTLDAMEEQIYWWQGTRQINAKTMQNVFGKRLDQEEVYCTFGPRHVKEGMDDASISKASVLDICRRLEDFHDIRFIALRRIQCVDSSVMDSTNVIDVDVAPASSSSSPSSSSLPLVSPDSATSVPSTIVTLPAVSTSHGQISRRSSSPHGQVGRRIVPFRICRQSEPNNAATTRFSKPPESPQSAAKRHLFPASKTQKKKMAVRPKKKFNNNHNRGSILGLQDPRTIQRGFFSTTAISTSSDNIFITTRTSTSTTRVVTPTPATTRNKEHDDNDDEDNDKKRKRRSSRLSSMHEDDDYDDDDAEMDKKPKALF